MHAYKKQLSFSDPEVLKAYEEGAITGSGTSFVAPYVDLNVKGKGLEDESLWRKNQAGFNAASRSGTSSTQSGERRLGSAEFYADTSASKILESEALSALRIAGVGAARGDG